MHVKEITEAVVTDIIVLEAEMHKMLADLDAAKKGNKRAAQRFRVQSVALDKQMKALRKLMLHG